MPNATVSSGATGTPVIALDSATTTGNTVTFSDDLTTVEIVTAVALSADVWWTCDGTAPNAGSGWFIPAGTVGKDSRQPPTSGNTVVRLYSTGTPSVRVQRGT